MIALLDFIDAHVDPHDPVHAEAREWVKRCRELLRRGAELADECRRLMDDDDLEGAEALVAQREAVTDELKAICERQTSVLCALRTSTDTMQ
jgi:hypothetical protein